MESVAWIAESKEVLSTFFWFLTTAAYLMYIRKPALMKYLAVTVSLTLGLMAKQTLVTLPFILLILDYWPLGRFRNTSRKGTDAGWLVLEKVPLVLISVLSGIMTLLAQ